MAVLYQFQFYIGRTISPGRFALGFNRSFLRRLENDIWISANFVEERFCSDGNLTAVGLFTEDLESKLSIHVL
jgi:hypothetical protein